jgi:signal transduction histidine kinase
MQKTTSSGSVSKTSSISTRFSYTLISVVSLLLILFTTIVILFNMDRIEKGMEKRLSNAITFAENSLPTPLWNLDYAFVHDFVEALFLDESIVYLKIAWKGQIIAERKRTGLNLPKFETDITQSLLKHSDLIAKSADIFYKENMISNLLIVMSREAVKKQTIFQIYGTIALLFLIIAGIWLTSIFITRRYISFPLSKLQESASHIANGDLDTFVDKSSTDEIGMLARHLDGMRGSIKRLFTELNDSKRKLEEYNRTLEEKVEIRTKELARSVDELKALGEISRTVSSTLDLETVLINIVQHAVQLSGADTGTIYEIDEETQTFMPSINFGMSDEMIRVLSESKLRVGDDTVIGQAALRKSPKQIPDLKNISNYPLSSIIEDGFRALLALPLLRKDRLIGGLIVRRKAPGEFPASVVEMLQTFAAQSVVAIHNAQLFSEIEEKGKELEIANRHKSEFLANMSHELRTPLNAILGFTELIIDNIYGDVPDKILEVLERVEKNGLHLLNLINDVLDLSKIEAGRLKLSLNDYSMRGIIETAVISIEALALEKQLKLSVNIQEDIGQGHGDEQRISQVILNLVGNAIKFTDQGNVSIEAKRQNQDFIVSISDTGPGLSEEDQKKIFEEFRQADGSSTRKKGGTGLGLSISKKIIEMHKGNIGVESTLGKGSTFWFSLPISVEV